MGERVKVEVDLVGLAERMRVAAERMRDDNFHDWAWLMNLGADCLMEANRTIRATAKSERG